MTTDPLAAAYRASAEQTENLRRLVEEAKQADTPAAVAALRRRVAELTEFARDVRDNYDHEACYHRDGSHEARCRKCKAEDVIGPH